MPARPLAVDTDVSEGETGEELTPRRRPSRVRRIDAPQLVLWVIVALVCLVPLSSALVGRTHLFAGDLPLQYAPWSQEIVENRTGRAPISDFVDWQIGDMRTNRERIQNGDLAEWDDLSGGGVPLMAMPHTGLYSPLGWIGWVVPPEYAPAVFKLLELVTSIAGMFLLGRVIGLSRGASLVGGLTYAFNGFQIVWSTNGQTFTGALIPFVFLATEYVVRRRRWTDVLWLAVGVAAMALGGFMAVSAYALYAAAFYLVVRFCVIGVQSWRRDPDRTAALRGHVSTQMRDGLRWGIGVAVGFGLTAVLMYPYYRLLSNDVLPDRGGRGQPLPGSLLTTLAFPHSYGVLNQRDWWGLANVVEGVGYVGAASLVLAGLAVVVVRWRSPRSVVLIPVVVTLVLFIGVTYSEVPVVSLIGELPGIGTSPFGRLRSVNAFLIAVLAALGADELISRARHIRNWERILTVGAASAALAGTVVFLHRQAQSHGDWHSVWRWIAVDVLAAAAVGVVILAWRGRGRGPGRGPSWTSVALVAVVAAEAMFFVVPYFPRTDPSVSMVETASHRYLADAMDGNDRIVTQGIALYPGTTKYFGIRSLTTHAWHPIPLQQYLEAIDPGAFERSPTFSFLDLLPDDRILSPLLDRAAARFAVMELGMPVPGDPGPSTPLVRDGRTSVFRAEVRWADLRGVLVTVDRVSVPPGSNETELHVELVSETGEGERSSDVRYGGGVPAGERSVPLAGEGLGSRTREVRVWIEDPATSEVLDAELSSIRPIHEVEDGLSLVHVSGVAIYERETALDRYRWAEDAVVETDPRSRLAILASPRLDDTDVVLHSETDDRGGPGSIIRVDDDDPDHRTIEVESSDGGWLVVADSMQSGWTAAVDGRPADLEPADHAFVAVHVPPGRHRVVLDYQAPGTGTGRMVTGASAVGLVGLGLWSHRSRGRT